MVRVSLLISDRRHGLERVLRSCARFAVMVRRRLVTRGGFRGLLGGCSRVCLGFALVRGRLDRRSLSLGRRGLKLARRGLRFGRRGLNLGRRSLHALGRIDHSTRLSVGGVGIARRSLGRRLGCKDTEEVGCARARYVRPLRQRGAACAP